MRIDQPVGIDLGTTNSEIAFLHPREEEVVLYADRFGRKTMPSAVAWDPKASAIVVGHAARARRGKEPAPIESIKRKMGKRVSVDVGPNAMSPEDVSAAILTELRQRMTEHMQSLAGQDARITVTRAVVTVPAYFDSPQVEATREAGKRAGLDVIGILQEPTAAAMYQTWRSRLGDGNFLVYDLGGGTFDVSVLRSLGGEYQVLAIDGDNYLGGDDFDRRVAEWIRNRLEKSGYKLTLDLQASDEDRARFAALIHLAQGLKESLSTSEIVHVSKSDLLVDQNGESVSFEAEVSRVEYNAIISDLVDTTITCAERALARSFEVAQVGIGEIDYVVLVGGSTRVPLVTSRVTESLASRSRGKRIVMDEVDTSVALGAAIFAAGLGGIVLTSDDERAAIELVGSLVSRSERGRIGIRLRAIPDGARDLVVEADSALVARVPIDARGAGGAIDASAAGDANIHRIDIAVSSSEMPVRVSLLDLSGESLATFPFALYRGDRQPRASALSRPTVIAKDIALDVTRGGKLTRKVLLARGTGLPAKSLHTLFTGDQSGVIVLRILEGRLPIKTLSLEVPRDLPVGTPVELDLRCDEKLALEARATVAGRELWAKLELPELPRFSNRAAVDSLLADVDNVSRSLWGSVAAAFRHHAEPLTNAIRELSSTDPDKLEAMCLRMRQLLDEFRGADAASLSPPLETFEGLVADLRRTVFRQTGAVLGRSADEWETRIGDLDARGSRAFEELDAAAYRRAWNEAQALRETLFQDEFATMKVDDPAQITMRATRLSSWAAHLLESIDDFVASGDHEIRAMQVAEQGRLRGWLADRVAVEIASVERAIATAAAAGEEGDRAAWRRSLDQAAVELERIEAALAKLPQLGVVADRGGSAAS